jgi:hypothetical protein
LKGCEVDENEFEVKGGSIDRSLGGNFKIELKEVAQEAWQLSKSGKSEMLQGAMLVVFVVIALIWGLQAFFGVNDFTVMPVSVQITVQILLTAITAPIVATLLFLGLSRSVGIRPSLGAVLKQMFGSFLIVLLALLTAFLIDLGVKLLLLPGLYLALATGFSMMLLVEKSLTPSQAIIQSLKVFNRHWAPLIIFYVSSLILFVLGMFSFGVLYIWLLPLYFNFKGILYRELFGVKVNKTHKVDDHKGSIFHA